MGNWSKDKHGKLAKVKRLQGGDKRGEKNTVSGSVAVKAVRGLVFCFPVGVFISIQKFVILLTFCISILCQPRCRPHF